MWSYPSRHPVVWTIICFFVSSFPQWFASVWSLYTSQPFIPWAKENVGIVMPTISALWITVPLGLLMFGFLLYDRYFIPSANGRISLLEFLDKAKKNGWDFGPQSLHIVDFANALRQSALDGSISLYGKPGNPKNLVGGEPLEIIPQDHWKKFSVNYGSLSHYLDNKETHTSTVNAYGFSDLHLIKLQAIKWLRDKQTIAQRGKTEIPHIKINFQQTFFREQEEAAQPITQQPIRRIYYIEVFNNLVASNLYNVSLSIMKVVRLNIYQEEENEPGFTSSIKLKYSDGKTEKDFSPSQHENVDLFSHTTAFIEHHGIRLEGQPPADLLRSQYPRKIYIEATARNRKPITASFIVNIDGTGRLDAHQCAS